MELKVGDCVEHPDDALALICQIVDVRPTGYSWRYLRMGLDVISVSLSPACRYRSENGDDPFFDAGWVRSTCAVPEPLWSV